MRFAVDRENIKKETAPQLKRKTECKVHAVRHQRQGEGTPLLVHQRAFAS
jgi:hypothetical protein